MLAFLGAFGQEQQGTGKEAQRSDQSAQVRPLSIVQQIEPTASGRQTCWCAAWAVRSARTAFPVLMLK